MKKGKKKKDKDKESLNDDSLPKERTPEEIMADTYNFQHGIYKNVVLKGKSLPFTKIHTSNKIWLRYLLVILMGLISGTCVLFLVKNTGLYSYGLSAALQGIAKLSYTSMRVGNVSIEVADTIYSIMFWCLYLLCNIPLLIFSYRRISKTFTQLTFMFLLFSTGTGLVLDLIPGIQNVFLFGDTSLVNDVSGGPHYSNVIENLNKFNIKTLPFWVPTGNFPTENYIKIFFLLIYSIVYALESACLYAVLYSVGASTAGMDIVSIYYSTKKQVNIGKILLIANLTSMFIGSFLGTYCSGGMINSSLWNFQFLLSSNFVFTIAGMIIFTNIFGKLFPKSKIVNVSVITNKYKEINESLKKIKYTHTTSLQKIIGGYSNQEKVVLSSMCMLIECATLIKFIREIDQKAIITVTPVIAYDGIMNVQQQRYK